MSRPKSEAAEAYDAIAEELSAPHEAKDILAQLNPEQVAMAKAYARRSKKKWPPKSVNTGIPMQIIFW